MSRLDGTVARLDGTVAMITGAESGMGAATATRFAAEGARLVLVGLRADALRCIAEELGAIAVPGDAADPEFLDAAVSHATSQLGRINVLTTCAGQATFGPGDALAETSDQRWEEGMRANLRTAMVSARAVLPSLIDGGGSIVMVASIGAISSGPESAVYTAAKTGLLGLVRSIAVDYGRCGVRANAVCPGPTRSPMSDGIVGEYAAARGISRDEGYTELGAHVPLPGPCEPHEIASACLFLASQDSAGITGASLAVDHGQSALSQAAIPFMVRRVQPR
ncbi:MAG TPA: SDR family oxidoreductase [Solirubrobacteraceae bacterium]|jgi:NAD(P)-dependent dehydrogenase (short-subunit alcohol dehydrogenase family)|nr:SDR family oxidoreductase [Solirubrobacteraceae bacterium]